ncbi:MAG: ATP-binding cassette domain-containing protein, partial [Clostridiales bacterium]|nr:ATP-binding cassette domain-containing protein [Clostridiales bacterium]
ISNASAQPLAELSDVSFRYGDDWILRDVSIRVGRGERVALVGESGSGKSTALRLIAGLYEPESGTARFSGRDVKEWSLRGLRRRLSYVQQDTYLYPGTLRDNVLCGREEFAQKLEPTLAGVRLSQWAAEQPGGFLADVGERGGKLSGGLRQRVSLARAIVRAPLLYLFDAPTSALDDETERGVTEVMREATGGAASLTVAHRLSSIADADRIYAMKEGRVVEEGTHAELMAAEGYYYSLYQLQSREADRESEVSDLGANR